MVKITGTLHINTGFVRIKPNTNFIGAMMGISAYSLSDKLELELNPTPAEGVYLVDYAIDITSPFIPSEHWIIPSSDCTFDEVRGVRHIADVLEKQLAEVKKQNLELLTINQQIFLDNQRYLIEIQSLESQLKTVKEKYGLIEIMEHQNNTSINIVNRFSMN